MSLPKTECRNKAQAELKAKRTLYVMTKCFSVVTLWKKIWNKVVPTILNSVCKTREIPISGIRAKS